MNNEMTEQRTHCIRCGECCLKSSPTLQVEDIPLVENGPVEKDRLFTIRAGELVHDSIEDRLVLADKELIKIKEHEDRGGCIFYRDKEKACIIYDHRPVQCAALACWDPSDFFDVYRQPKAQRKDFIRDRTLLALIEEHDKRCSYRQLETLVQQIEQEGDAAVEKIMDMLKFDYELRPFISKKLGIDLDEMDFMFGRPLVETITMFGLKVVNQPDGTFFLTVSPAP